jgi:hypothetical protein
MSHSDHADLADLLDLDAEVLREHHREVTAWVAALVPAASCYALVSLQRMRHRLEGRLPAADLAGLDVITAGLADRDDLTVTASRTIWLARRPG